MSALKSSPSKSHEHSQAWPRNRPQCFPPMRKRPSGSSASSPRTFATGTRGGPYYKAACRFSDWCEGRGLLDLAAVKPPHVATYIEMLGLPETDGAGLS